MPLQCTSSGLWYIHTVVQLSSLFNFGTFLSLPKRNPVFFSCHSLLSQPCIPSPRQLALCFLPLQICLYWTLFSYKWNHIIYNVWSLVAVFPFGIIFSRSIHDVEMEYSIFSYSQIYSVVSVDHIFLCTH
jgi:hypothetical protein